eukprot:scaffold421042_cov45-Prasinocladus_malaysianus.AAC.1
MDGIWAPLTLCPPTARGDGPTRRPHVGLETPTPPAAPSPLTSAFSAAAPTHYSPAIYHRGVSSKIITSTQTTPSLPIQFHYDEEYPPAGLARVRS